MTDTNSSDLGVETEIQATTNAFRAQSPKLKKLLMFNGAVLPSLIDATECSQEADLPTFTPSTKFPGKIAGRNS